MVSCKVNLSGTQALGLNHADEIQPPIFFAGSFVLIPVSPPQEHIQGAQWWTDYQPVSYNLTSKRGDRAQFASMISTCDAAGVGVISGQYDFILVALLSYLLILLCEIMNH